MRCTHGWIAPRPTPSAMNHRTVGCHIGILIGASSVEHPWLFLTKKVKLFALLLVAQEPRGGGTVTCTPSSFIFHHHSKRAVLCVVMPYTIQRSLCVTNGHCCVEQGPYSLLGLYGDLGLTYTDCCVVQGHSDLAILHPYCLRMWISYNGVQATAQQRYGCQLPCTHCSIV
jgi:hypothetical protein